MSFLACNTALRQIFVDWKFVGVLQALQLYLARRDDGLAMRMRKAKRVQEVIANLPAADAEWIIDRVGLTPNVQLRDVLNRLVNEHSAILGPLLSSRYDRFISEIINTVDYVTRREPEARGIALQGARLYWMTEKLRILLSACFLRELGFSGDKVVALFRRNATYQHIGRWKPCASLPRRKASPEAGKAPTSLRAQSASRPPSLPRSSASR